jgi:molybdate transport system regulatory protein
MALQIRVKLNLVDDRGDPFMGPGVLSVLRGIQEHGSINRAAGRMRLSYMKALKMLNRLEADLGKRILVRKRGGNDRGGSELTPLGRRFIVEYDRLERRVRTHVEKEFRIFQERVAAAELDDS